MLSDFDGWKNKGKNKLKLKNISILTFKMDTYIRANEKMVKTKQAWSDATLCYLSVSIRGYVLYETLQQS